MHDDEPRFDDENFEPSRPRNNTLLIVLLLVGGGLFFVCTGIATLGFFAYQEVRNVANQMPPAIPVPFNANTAPNQMPGGLTPSYGSLLATGEYEAALQELNAALESNPESDFLHNNKAWLLATCPVAEVRSGQEALVHATKACELTEYNNYMYVDTLAAAYAEAGDFEQAVQFQMSAVELTPQNIPGRDSIVQRVKLFESKRAFREGVIPVAYTPTENNDQPNLPETKDKGRAATEIADDAKPEVPDASSVEDAELTKPAPAENEPTDPPAKTDQESSEASPEPEATKADETKSGE